MTDSKPHSSRATIVAVVKWLFAAVLLVWIYRNCSDGIAQLKDRKLLPEMFFIALAVRLVSLLATFARWRMLVRGIGLPFSVREAFRLGMFGEACNMMGPGAVGGDLVKVALLAKDHPQRTASVFATVFLDRILGLWALFVLGALASLIPSGVAMGPAMQGAVWILWGGSAAGLIGIVLMLVPAFTHSRLMHWLTTWRFIGKIVKELMDSIQLYQGNPQVVFGAAAIGFIGHFGFLTAFFFCAQALHQGQVIPTFVDHIVGLPLPEAISAVPLTPGGIGTLEKAVEWFYRQHQQSAFPESTDEQLANASLNGTLTALGFRLTMWICGAIGIVYYFSMRKEIDKAVHGLENDEGRTQQASGGVNPPLAEIQSVIPQKHID